MPPGLRGSHKTCLAPAGCGVRWRRRPRADGMFCESPLLLLELDPQHRVDRRAPLVLAVLFFVRAAPDWVLQASEYEPGFRELSAWLSEHVDPDREAVVTLGSKEGLAHLALAILAPGDVVFCPSPTYPIHQYSVILAGGDLRSIPMVPGGDFFGHLVEAMRQTWPKPKLLVLNFPHNPTTEVVDKPFFEKIVAFAHEHGLMVVHDLVGNPNVL